MRETTKKTLVLIMVIMIISYFVAMITFALTKDSQSTNTNEETASQLDRCLDSAYRNYQELWDKAAEENGTPGKVPYSTGLRLDRSYENQKEDCYRYEEVTR